MGIGALLMLGIGDTLRVSLTADVEEEIKAGYEILKALDLRHRGVRIISCPTCARRGYDVQKTVEELERRLRSRGDTPEDQIALRMERAKWEMDQRSWYNHVVVNDVLDDCVNEMAKIIGYENV